MEFYDIVSETCAFDAAFERRLGFSKIFTINREIRAVGHGSENEQGLEGGIAFGKDPRQLIALAKRGVSAVAISDSYIDRKLIEAMGENGCVLCLPMSAITASYGPERSRNIYKMSKLLSAARKAGIDACFASMAKTPLNMNSCMQLLELAKLVGAEEKYARYCLGEVARSLVVR